MKQNIDAILAEMTLREKATIVVGAGWGSLFEGFNLPFAGSHRVPGAAGETRAIPRLEIPSIILADGPAGVRIKQQGATAFPSAISLASSGDPDLVREVGRAIGEEARALGVSVLLAPGMNLMRNPLCGRNFEYFSEDADLSSRMAAAFIEGVQSAGVGCTAKHFALNNQETNRFHNDVKVDEETLQKLYLENFRKALEASKPWAIMASYNSVNGTPVQTSKHLLTDVLRDQWHYEGVVMSDWQRHGNPAEKIAAGVDLLMPGSCSNIRSICRAVRQGKLSEERLNEAVRRVLTLVAKATQASQDRSTQTAATLAPEMKSAHAQLARKAGAAGCVVLKNENKTLPLALETKKPGLMGVASYATVCGGTGSGFVNSDRHVSIAEAFKAIGCKMNGRSQETYEGFMANPKNLRKPKGVGFFSKYMAQPTYNEFRFFSEDTVENVVDYSDVTIITISRQCGEGEDVRLEPGGYYLSSAEEDLLRMCSARCIKQDKRLVVVLNTPHLIDIASWQHQADAILLAWTPGQEAGHAIVDVLTGAHKPSGKLPVTIPVKYEDLPSAANFPTSCKGTKTPEGCKDVDFTRYEEGQNIGHYYFDQHPETEVAYKFGFGLTY